MVGGWVLDEEHFDVGVWSVVSTCLGTEEYYCFVGQEESRLLSCGYCRWVGELESFLIAEFTLRRSAGHNSVTR